MTSDVPQGLVPGPLLFVIYLNDLDVGMGVGDSKFTNDAKISRVDSVEGSLRLQSDIEVLMKWAKNGKWI